jgi:hydrogenase maturation protein HypF
VWIAVWGAARALDDFARRLVEEAPPLACVTAVESEPLTGAAPDALFRIAPSGAGQAGALIPPDAATCPACLAEVRDPARRRYGHAFANCTHCGPRLTIARAIPWDRAQTSMADFPCARPVRRNMRIRATGVSMPSPLPAPIAGRACGWKGATQRAIP